MKLSVNESFGMSVFLLLMIVAFSPRLVAVRILMTSLQFRSHVTMQLAVAKELVKRGHEVYVAIGSRYPNSTEFQEAGVHRLDYHVPSDALYAISDEFDRLLSQLIFNPPTWWYCEDIVEMSPYDKNCNQMMADQQFLERLVDLQFDFAVVEPMVLAPCSLILPYYLNIRFAAMTSGYLPSTVGLPALPSFYEMPGIEGTIFTGISDNDFVRSFWYRLQNSVLYFFAEIFVIPLLWGNTELIKRCNCSSDGNPDLSWIDILRRAELYLTTHDHHIESASLPLFPNVIPVPGLTVRAAEQLPQSIEQIMAGSEPHGVIVVSFGSTQAYTPADVLLKFFDVFGRLEQTVIARFVVPDGLQRRVPSNVKLISWLPQNDLLGHNKTRLFITHCGYHSLHEAVYHGVPMIAFPLFGDHHWNCEQARRKHLLVVMNVLDFEVEQLYENIVQLLPVNSTCRQAVAKRSAIYRDQPMFGREKAAFWLDHVITHGGQHLRSPAQTMPMYQMRMLDLIAVASLLIAAVLAAAVQCFRLWFLSPSKYN